MDSILNYFPRGFTPMDEQVYMLLEIEEKWDEHEVILIDGPVALGKSLIAITILNWQNGGAYIVPDNALLKQVTDEFPDLPKLLGREKYICPKGDCTSVEDWTCDKQARATGRRCFDCPMEKDRARDRGSTKGAYTYYGYYSNRRFRNLVIVDEAHKLTSWLRDLYTKRLWKHKLKWPDPASPEVLLEWTKTFKKKTKEASRVPNKAVQALQSSLNGKAKSSISYRSRELFRGHMMDLIKVSPAIKMGTALWPNHKVDKIVLMSATMSDMNLKEIGLQGKSIARITSKSPIPPENRPVMFTNDVRVTFENRDESIIKLSDAIDRIVDQHEGESGIVHLPYSLAEAMQKRLKGNPRYIFHSRENRLEMLDNFLSSPGTVFLASGFAEGISLNYDKARFNIVTKAAFPNMQDPFVTQMADRYPQWATEQVIQHMLQAYGRVCRRPDDRGVTYMLDELSYDVYKGNQKLIPQWFKDAVIIA